MPPFIQKHGTYAWGDLSEGASSVCFDVQARQQACSKCIRQCMMLRSVSPMWEAAMWNAHIFHNTLPVVQSRKYLWCTRSQLLYRVQGPHTQERSVQSETNAERVNKESRGWKISFWKKTKSVLNPEKNIFKGYTAALYKCKTWLNRKMRYYSPSFLFYQSSFHYHMLVEGIYLSSESFQCAPYLGNTLGELWRSKVIIFWKYNHLFIISGISEVMVYKIKVVSEVIKKKGVIQSYQWRSLSLQHSCWLLLSWSGIKHQLWYSVFLESPIPHVEML